MAKDTLYLNVKSDIGEVTKGTKELSKESKNAAGEFKVMGVSLNGVKAGFASAGKSAKMMFGSIKAGLISSGIGLFIVAIGALVSYFTNTKKGAEKLSQAFSGIGAAIAVVTDRISAIGGAISKVFSGDFKGAVQDVKGALTGIGDEMSREISLAVELEKTFQRIADSERGLNLERAEANKIIAKARLDAEDETKTLEERMTALQKANTEELKITAKALALQKEKVEATRQEVGMGESMAEDLDKLNEEKIKLINMETASFSMQKRLTTGLETLKVEAATKERAREKARQDGIKEEAKSVQDRVNAEKKQIQELIDLEQERLNKLIVEEAALLDKFNESQLEAQDKETNAIYDKYFAIIEGKISLGESVVELEENQQSELFAVTEKYRIKGLAADEASANKKKAIEKSKVLMQADMANQGLQILASAAGEGTALAKAAAIAQATISGVQGVQNAFTSANANIGATAGSFGAYPVTMAALAGTFAAMNIAKIASGGKTGGAGARAGAAPQTPAPQMMSGAFDISGGVAPEPLEAFVITDKMTSSQNQLANIRRRATI
jgi:hypothetical protein